MNIKQLAKTMAVATPLLVGSAKTAAQEVTHTAVKDSTHILASQEQLAKNYIVDLTDLPKKLRKLNMRKAFDVDHNGFIESQGKKGIDEINIMENATGTDLSKYKKEGTVSTYTSYVEDGDYGYPISTANYKDGSVISIMGQGAVDENRLPAGQIRKDAFYNGYDRMVVKGNITTQKSYDKDGNFKEWLGLEQGNVKYNGMEGFTKSTYCDKNGTTETYIRGSIADRYESNVGPKDFRWVMIKKDKHDNVTSIYDFGTDPNTVDSTGNGKLMIFTNFDKNKQ